ncbi:MAG: phospholipase D family protein [Deltaproteobacteria bacterium HGW-Deltaproteobacteria-8]|jgi:phosphatidylserine/phosphatidylglycerophosphate/cardiolipin synthase-like enzyme|nr:MAG: phospholipase D family protein [Deltaproteobacteria bacterium HGW-Deltaproteobacteria-8]
MRRPVFALLLLLALSPAQALELTLHNAPAEIHFSPRGGAAEALVHRIDLARESIFVLAYSFTSAPIADALGRAARRGVHVEAVLDRGQRTARGSQGGALAASGATVYVDSRHAIAHNKVMVLDGQAVVTGSFNFTKGAEEKNAENLLILDSPELARLYREEWEKHRGHAAPW